MGAIPAASAAEELRILAWQGYADDDWVAEFEKETGAEVNVVFAQTDDEIWAKIKGSEGKDFDLFAVNTAQLQRYIDAGLAAPHDLAKLPNQKQTLPRFRDLSKVRGVRRDGKVYGIPFAFDSIGLIYDTTKVNPPPDSMNVLWDPTYKGKILLYDNGEHNFSFAALAEGHRGSVPPHRRAAAGDQGQADRAEEERAQLLPTADEALQIYNSNDVALILANYGQQQVKLMKEAGAPIAYVVPEGRRARLARHLGDDKGAKNTELAEKWVNFVLQKKISSALSERTGFGNTVTPLASAGADDKLVWLLPVEDSNKRTDLWNEIKAARPQ